MNSTEQSGTRDVHRALQELRIRTTANLRAFNDAVPHASWLRRSEIERFTDALLQAAQQAPERRQLTPFGRIRNAFSAANGRFLFGPRPVAADIAHPEQDK